MLAEARVGTSGFSYREWVGTVYPAGLSEAQTLALYASQLGAVEVQSRLPDEATLADWAEAAPPGFEFALKLAGHDPELPYMRRARDLIRALGGAAQCNSFTKFYLALLGQFPYANCPGRTSTPGFSSLSPPSSPSRSTSTPPGSLPASSPPATRSRPRSPASRRRTRAPS